MTFHPSTPDLDAMFARPPRPPLSLATERLEFDPFRPFGFTPRVGLMWSVNIADLRERWIPVPLAAPTFFDVSRVSRGAFGAHRRLTLHALILGMLSLRLCLTQQPGKCGVENSSSFCFEPENPLV